MGKTTVLGWNKNIEPSGSKKCYNYGELKNTLFKKVGKHPGTLVLKYSFEGVTDLEEGINARMETNKRISEGMKRQIGNIRKRRGSNYGSEDDPMIGARSKSYYLDVIFVQIVLLMLLYGVCVLVVPKLV